MLQRKLKVLFLITAFLVILGSFVVVISLVNVTSFAKNNSYTAPVKRVPYVVKGKLDIWELKQGPQPSCKKVRSIKPKNNPIIENNPIIVIDPSPNNSITCNVDGKNYTLNRLLELKPNDSFVKKHYYVLLKEGYVTKKTADNTFNFNDQAQPTQSVTLYTKVDPTTNNCSLESSSKINPNDRVTKSEPSEIIYCNILSKDGVLYQFEMFKVNYSGQETTVTGYVAQENLKTPRDTDRKIFRTQFRKI